MQKNTSNFYFEVLKGKKQTAIKRLILNIKNKKSTQIKID